MSIFEPNDSYGPARETRTVGAHMVFTGLHVTRADWGRTGQVFYAETCAEHSSRSGVGVAMSSVSVGGRSFAGGGGVRSGPPRWFIRRAGGRTL